MDMICALTSPSNGPIMARQCVLKNVVYRWRSLTVSTQMYVPGTLNDVEHVLVDVGTGYYVEKVTYLLLNVYYCQLCQNKWYLIIFYLSRMWRTRRHSSSVK